MIFILFIKYISISISICTIISFSFIIYCSEFSNQDYHNLSFNIYIVDKLSFYLLLFMIIVIALKNFLALNTFFIINLFIKS